MSPSRDANRTGPYQPESSKGPPERPEQLGRYRVKKVLGKGSFAVVYLAHDKQLERLVALKVPHRRLVSRPENAQPYLAEARIVAGLDHPHIVPLFDVGSTVDHPLFFVSKFIQGSTLAKRIKEDRPSFSETAELVASVAEALHYAHQKGIVHRDIKPGNILLDGSGRPLVADFGLALKEEDFGRGAPYAGTPAYMSPEQASAQADKVDGRSDIFSLGVVFYELLTGRRPFRGETRDELLEQIVSVEARPPRQVNDAIPKELERICLKALSKRPSERYTTAKDMAEDLRCSLAPPRGGEEPAVWARHRVSGPALAAPTHRPATPAEARWPNLRMLGASVMVGALTIGILIFLLRAIPDKAPLSREVGRPSVSPDGLPTPTSDELRIDRISIATEACLWKHIYAYSVTVNSGCDRSQRLSPSGRVVAFP